MDDLVQHVVRELSFEGDLGEPLVLHLIRDHLGLRDFPHQVQVMGVRLSSLPFSFFYLTGDTSRLLKSSGNLRM